MIHFVFAWLDKGGDVNQIKPFYPIIKTDLEFISQKWKLGCIDLWEETEAKHFYTEITQRSSLLWGAQLAERFGDAGAQRFYAFQAEAINADLKKFGISFLI